MSQPMKPVATEAEVVITHEDVDRAHDRSRVSAARARRGFSSNARLLWLLAGPGVLVMLGENDGPSMLAYAATGADFVSSGAITHSARAMDISFRLDLE